MYFRSYKSSYRLASRARLRPASASKRSVITVQLNRSENHDHYFENFSKLEDKLPVNMCSSESTTAISLTSCHFSLYFHCQKESEIKLPSRLEIVFLLESGASSLVHNLPTSMKITQMFNVCNQGRQGTSKTLTIENESVVPVKQ